MPKRSTRGFAMILVPVLAVLFLVGAGTVYYLKNTENKTRGSSPTSSPSIIPDNWLTFQNTTYLYQISYDPRFHAQGQNEPPYPPPPVGKSFTHKWDNNEWCDFTILVAPGINGFEGEMESLRKEEKETETQTTLVGLPASIFDAQGGDAINRSYYLTKDTIQYRLGYNYRPAAKYSQECADIVIKMVSSFKFL